MDEPSSKVRRIQPSHAVCIQSIWEIKEQKYAGHVLHMPGWMLFPGSSSITNSLSADPDSSIETGAYKRELGPRPDRRLVSSEKISSSSREESVEIKSPLGT